MFRKTIVLFIAYGLGILIGGIMTIFFNSSPWWFLLCVAVGGGGWIFIQFIDYKVGE